MELSKEMLEYVATNLAAANRFEIPDGEVFDKQVHRPPLPVALPLAKTLEVSTLRSFAEYVTANRDALDLSSFVIHVASPQRVELVGALENLHRRREVPVAAVYAPGDSILDKWLDLETAIIGMMTGFAQSGDRDAVIELLKKVTSEGVEIREDDGMSQNVTVRQGVATVGRATTPNPVILAPYRTFTEVEEQAASLFILRLRQGPAVLIKPADGNAWRVTAAESVAVTLERMLSDGHPPILH